MNRPRFLSIPMALAALLACTSPLQWNAACACAEFWTGVVGDVGVYWGDMKEEDVTPEFLAAKTLDKLRGRDVDLKQIRSVGPFFDSSCIRAMSEVRCVFWLWNKGDRDMRGIELRFLSDPSRKITGVTGEYVYGQRNDPKG